MYFSIFYFLKGVKNSADMRMIEAANDDGDHIMYKIAFDAGTLVRHITAA